MGYKVDKPEGAPSWFVPGIRCNVWDGKNKTVLPVVPVVWYTARYKMKPFIDEDGCRWEHAYPIESWEPVEGEWVAAWDNRHRAFRIGQCLGTDQKSFMTTAGYFDHIARITDGLDLRCTPEELKQRTEWK